jgi:hypothetical protein
MKLYLVFILMCVGCLHDAYEPPPNYYQDSLYCYHKDSNGAWQVSGLARQCPYNTKYVK